VNKLGRCLARLLTPSVKTDLAHSFCGFYAAKADTKIFKKAAQVVLACQGDKTVVTMVNDFNGSAGLHQNWFKRFLPGHV